MDVINKILELMREKKISAYKLSLGLATGKIELKPVYNMQKRTDEIKPVITLKHPFDEFEEDFTVIIPNKFAERRGRFLLKAKKEIVSKDLTEIPVTVKVRLLEFKDNVKRQKLSFVSFLLDSPFEENVSEIVMPERELKGTLVDYAREQLNLITIEEQEKEKKTKVS